ncbi:hypothetical protein PHYC_03355 [Phycisphaerales bacterium]|nr:hypothetical protein PHYC_03355 [Phycisphaerales bacterium]
MAKRNEVTSRSVATKASKVLRDKRFSKTSKSVAGSALTQRPSKRSKAK